MNLKQLQQSLSQKILQGDSVKISYALLDVDQCGCENCLIYRKNFQVLIDLV